jgi:ABC-type uncharacterized transport system ATPase component
VAVKFMRWHWQDLLTGGLQESSLLPLQQCTSLALAVLSESPAALDPAPEAEVTPHTEDFLSLIRLQAAIGRTLELLHEVNKRRRFADV